MPRYFFHVRDGKTFTDETGTILSDVAEAKQHAVKFAGQLLSYEPQTFWEGTEWVLRVTDENDLTLFTLTFFATDGAVNC
jgi:hypothetical protein